MSHGKSLRAIHTELFQRQERAREKAGNVTAVRPELERHSKPRNVGASKAQAGDRKRFLVRVTSIRRRLIDEDNLCEKFVVDCCRHSGVLPDDAPDQTRIEVAQRKAGKEEDESTLVEIFEQ